MTTATTDLCPHCDVAPEVIRERREVPLGQRRVTIDDEYLRCPKCGEQYYTLAQAEQRQERAVAQSRQDASLLAPHQIRQIRTELGLTLSQFEQLLGVGEKTCIRWEKGRVCQNVATDRLIRLIAANRANAAILAAVNGITLPDSCFVPAHSHFQEEPWWRPSPQYHELHHQLTIRGTAEPDEFSTKEHAIVVQAADDPIEIRAIPQRAMKFYDRTQLSASRLGGRGEH